MTVLTQGIPISKMGTEGLHLASPQQIGEIEQIVRS
jgi:hypothetical protein